jgi:hypothetical protein
MLAGKEIRITYGRRLQRGHLGRLGYDRTAAWRISTEIKMNGQENVVGAGRTDWVVERRRDIPIGLSTWKFIGKAKQADAAADGEWIP